MSQKISCERDLGKPIRNAKIWDQIRSYHKYSEFVPCVESIIQENSCPFISEWLINIDGAPLSWQQLDSFELQNGCLKFELTNGDFDQLYGQWSVMPTSEPNQFRISLQLEYSLGMPVLEDMLGNIIQEKLTSFIVDMVEANIKKIEENYVDERKFKRLKVGTSINFSIDNQMVTAELIDISQGGMLLKNISGEIETGIEMSLKIAGVSINSVCYDYEEKNYLRVVFGTPLSQEDLNSILLTLKNKSKGVKAK